MKKTLYSSCKHQDRFWCDSRFSRQTTYSTMDINTFIHWNCIKLAADDLRRILSSVKEPNGTSLKIKGFFFLQPFLISTSGCHHSVRQRAEHRSEASYAEQPCIRDDTCTCFHWATTGVKSGDDRAKGSCDKTVSACQYGPVSRHYRYRGPLPSTSAWMHHVSAGHFHLGCAAMDDVKQLFLLIEGLLHYRNCVELANPH